MYPYRELTGISTGYDNLDDIMGGFNPSELIVVGACPRIGATAFVLYMAGHAASRANIPTMLFSLSHSRDQVWQRLLCAEGLLNQHRFKSGSLNEKESGRLAKWSEKLKTAPLIIDDTVAISVSELCEKARQAHSESKFGLIVVDYLQLMTGAERTSDRRLRNCSDHATFEAIGSRTVYPNCAVCPALACG